MSVVNSLNHKFVDSSRVHPARPKPADLTGAATTQEPLKPVQTGLQHFNSI